MNKKIPLLGTALVAGLMHTSFASAVLFNQNVTPDVIFGSGNANGSFTVDQNNGVELGLRGKLRHNASGSPENTFNSNGDGTYSFAAGVAPTQLFPTAVWSFEWSINSNFDGNSGFNLDDLVYQLGLDIDPSQGTSFTSFDPINVPFADHAIGTNATGNGGGAVAAATPTPDTAGYATLIANNNVAQNSWKAHWFFSPFDPTVDGTYNLYLTASDQAGGQLARTDIQIIVGQGGASVPEPATLALICLGLAGIGYSRQGKKKAV